MAIISMTPAKKATSGYYLGFITLGMAAASLGPTLPGLSEQVGAQISQMGFLFSARSVGFLLGALLAGRLFDRLPGHRLLTLALFGVALMMAMVPIISSFWVITAVFFFLGLSESGIDVGSNTLIVWVHGKAVGPYMNGLHFFFGVGSFLAPIIIAQVITLPNGMQWAYWMLALLMLPAVLYMWRIPSPDMPETAQEAIAGVINWPVVGLIALFFFLYSGAEIAYGGWIYTYALATGTGTVSSAAYLTSIFWASLTLGRLLGIPIAARLRARLILFIDLAGCLVSLGLILLAPETTAVVWVGTIALGLFMASIFPTTLTLAERNTNVSGSVTSYFFVGASLGGMTIPWLVGRQFEQSGSQAVMVIIFGCLILASAVYALLMRQIKVAHVAQAQP
jgi:MFS transporter, FHS family, Na+ dependent glucose transporter 1